MKKLILLIIFLFCLINAFAEETVSVSSNTAVEDNFGVQAVISTDTVKISSNTKIDDTTSKENNSVDTVNSSTNTVQVNKSTDTVNVSTNTANENNASNQIIKSTDTINVSTNTANESNIANQVVNSTDTVNVSSAAIDITKPLKYKEVKADKNIEVSSTTVIPDENDLGTYYSSGAIVEKPQKDSNYDLNLPTTTALGIAGEKVLDKLNLNKSTDTVNAGDVGSSTTTAVTPSSSTVTQEDKKQPKKEDKKETQE